MKSKNITAIIVVVMLIFAIHGCDTDSHNPVTGLFGAEEPKFTIVSRIKSMTTYGRPKVTIIVENTGRAVGYNVSCDIQAKKGDTIIDSGFAYFANGSDIDPGEKAQDEAVFFELTSLDGYQLEYDLSWLEHW